MPPPSYPPYQPLHLPPVPPKKPFFTTSAGVATGVFGGCCILPFVLCLVVSLAGNMSRGTDYVSAAGSGSYHPTQSEAAAIVKPVAVSKTLVKNKVVAESSKQVLPKDVKYYLENSLDAIFIGLNAAVDLSDLCAEASRNVSIIATVEWRTRLENACEAMKDSEQKISKLIPPKAAKQLHAALLQTAAHLRKSANAFSQGTDELSHRKITMGVRESDEVIASGKIFVKRLRELASKYDNHKL